MWLSLESENIDQLFEQIQTPTFKAIVKFRKHPSIQAINDSFANRCFPFSTIEKKDVSSESVTFEVKIEILTLKLHRILIF